MVRDTDTEDDLARKVEMATVLGTIQSSLTYFPFLRPEWSMNAQEERLLGVSMTGIFDNHMTRDFRSGELQGMLQRLRRVAVDTNKKYAPEFGVEPSKAITTNKPSGTVSCLVDSSSGIHPRFAPFYVRRARIDKKDPMYAFLKDQGLPCEDCVMNPDSTAVFSFKSKAPSAVLPLSPLDHFTLWRIYKQNWTHHNPSVTINYDDDTFLELGAEVYKHFDSICGVSFLPRADHVYAQAPFEAITQEEYEAMADIDVDWSMLQQYETHDTTKSSHTMACTGGSCEIVDIESDDNAI